MEVGDPPLGPPAAGIPTYAVLGNHDYPVPRVVPHPQRAVSVRELRAALGAIGVRVLNNEAVPLDPPATAVPAAPAAPLYLVGIGADLPGADAPRAAIRQVPPGAPRVVLMHHPASFPALPAGAAPVALAGHTHGGQIRVPFKPDWSGWSWFQRERQPSDGWRSPPEGLARSVRQAGGQWAVIRCRSAGAFHDGPAGPPRCRRLAPDR